MSLVFSGRVWKFGDNINTDLMYPQKVFTLPPEQRPAYCMEANRPGWSKLVKKGDIVIGGLNFGTGSGRPAPQVLLDLGISCLVAESINGLFFRNSVNHAFPILECPGIHQAFEEGDEAEVDIYTAEVKNMTKGTSLRGVGLPKSLIDLVEAGGVLAVLRREGYIKSGHA